MKVMMKLRGERTSINSRARYITTVLFCTMALRDCRAADIVPFVGGIEVIGVVGVYLPYSVYYSIEQTRTSA